MKQKDEKILQLEIELQAKNKSVSQQLWVQIAQLQESPHQLKFQHQSEINSKDTQIHQLQLSIEKMKDVPNIDEFRKEDLELNTLLESKQFIFY